MTTIDNSTILQNLCNKVKITLPPTTVSDNTTTCTICTVPINSTDSYTLKCNHIFHYDCIYSWYKTCADKFMSSPSNFKCQTCPYCRKKGGWLPIKEGTTPIEYIHTDHIKMLSKKLQKKKLANPAYNGGPSLFSNPNPNPIGAGIIGAGDGKVVKTIGTFAVTKATKAPKAPKIICSAIKGNGNQCKYAAHHADSTGTIKYCGIHKDYQTKLVCQAIIAYGPNKGLQCKNTAKIPNTLGVLKCCGNHKYAVNHSIYLVPQ